ncbi:DNA-binding transcriptional regulator [Geothrix sp. 21YS21S-4]|uniref:helix-turn-helix domain-containing protein n=1 Tax=Geothrix sp. 21YS21S-4 TaxID=3068889 RepID=UPI0027B9EC8E|nr:helix-turn-helix transcriptional regulator [Geothrix sp. 21YS21S-4]
MTTKTRRAPKNWFPENLKQIRESLNMGQRTFAEYLQVTQQTVSLWETGARKPGRRTWTLLEQRLDYSRAELETASIALPAAGVAESKAFTRPVHLPLPRPDHPVTGMELNGLAIEALDLAKAQRLLREAVREGRPIWLIRG